MASAQHPFDDLHRKIETTTRARYIAANRLATHQRFSQWILAALSVELILIPLFQAMNVPLRTSPEVLNAIEVFLAVLVLAYSQLLGAENYALHADKMLSSGRELGRLNRELTPYIGKPYDAAIYMQFVERYHDILDKYANHADVDYDVYRLKNRRTFYPQTSSFVWAWITTRMRYGAGYLHYSLVLVFTGLSILYIFYWQ
ncbi:MAG TPA: SLATT domain-containing protein [Herpetosiphonaceae bacterium]